MSSTLKVKVWGDFALFTRPESKAERVSYPVMTPSAARGILEGIFWKPEFKWRVRSIHILKPIQYYSILRNEVASIVPTSITKSRKDYLADEDRQQRHSLMLRNVAYIIEADIELMEHTTDNITKYREMFRRRVAKGQCFHRPYFGTRECSVHFAEPNDTDKAIDVTDNLGPMLFDLKFPKGNEKNPQAIPYFFEANVENGVLHVPDYLYEEVYR
ncbi:type I-C CRISPR-associated protein Cas5c [Sporosarcina sp. FSL K6-3457]|uniref:type I-C CRISPR-associated protein Cas5c n=1 Tax=Sporosarcina sp. FSL K6-3457 TaxID=2978204 RepID=UPI0030F69A0A